MKAIAHIVIAVIITATTVWIIKPVFQKQVKETIAVVDTIIIPGDSIPYVIEVPVPIPYDSIRIDTIYKYLPVDTVKILERYFSTYYYCDTIQDSTVTIVLKEQLSQNKIADRQVLIQNLRPQTISYIVDTPSKILMGINASGFNGKIGIGAGLIYARKRDAFMVNVDVLNPGITAGYYLKFK